MEQFHKNDEVDLINVINRNWMSLTQQRDKNQNILQLRGSLSFINPHQNLFSMTGYIIS